MRVDHRFTNEERDILDSSFEEIYRHLPDLADFVVCDAVSLKRDGRSRHLGWTDGVHIYLGADAFTTFTPVEIAALIYHEWLHIYFGHVARGIDVAEKVKKEGGNIRGAALIWNVVIDEFINHRIPDSFALTKDHAFLKEGCFPLRDKSIIQDPNTLRYDIEESVFFEYWNDPDREEIPQIMIDILIPGTQSPLGEGSDDKGSVGGSGDGSGSSEKEGNSDESGCAPSPGPSREDIEDATEELRREIYRLRSVNPSGDPIPEPLRNIQQDHERKHSPPGRSTSSVHTHVEEADSYDIDWDVFLRKYMTLRLRKVTYDFSYSRPHRASAWLPSNPILPSLKKKEVPRSIYVAVDVSGSMPREEIMRAMEEVSKIRTLFRGSRLRIQTFNADLVECWDSTGRDRTTAAFIQEMQIGGGTDIHPVLEDILKMKPTVAIVLTDGEFYLDDTTAVPSNVIWTLIPDSRETPHLPGVVLNMK